MDSRAAAESAISQGGDDLSLPVDQHVVDALFSATYEELRRLAATVRQTDGQATLSPTTLVNEAWLKLSSKPPISLVSALHFKRIAARAMRQVLVEAARRRNAARRGGGALIITLDDDVQPAIAGTDELLALDQALNELARLHPRQATMVEARFFGGLDVRETAQALGVSEATVLRDWRVARAWLANELHAS